MYKPESKEEEDYLRSYDPGKYPTPAVTVDIVIFTLNEQNRLAVLLIRRKNYPYRGRWAIPGGFVEMEESIDTAAGRELFEETHVSGVPIDQFGSFGDVDRDPRMRVISIAYMAFVPKNALQIRAGDDAKDARLFEIVREGGKIRLHGEEEEWDIEDLAFDHDKVLRTAIRRLCNRIEYTYDAFALLPDDQSFSIGELKRIYDAVLNKEQDLPNFRREFERKYVREGLVEKTGGSEKRDSRRPAKLYRLVKTQ